MPKLKGHYSEPSKEESKAIRAVLNESKNQKKMQTRNNTNRQKNKHTAMLLYYCYKDDR